MDKLADTSILSREYVSFEAHEQAVTDVSLAPDGNVMCTSSVDGRVKFWDTSGLVNDRPRNVVDKMIHFFPQKYITLRVYWLRG